MLAALRQSELMGRFFYPLALLSGAGWGAALTRWLFESWPQTFGWLSTWPGVVILALGGAGLAVWLQSAKRESGATMESSWATLPLLLPALSLFSPEVDLLRALTLLLGSAALFLVFLFLPKLAQPSPQLGSWDLALGIFLAVFLLSFYLLTLSPFVGEADPFEFQVNVARLGISHGNGYPLLTLWGKLFEILPLGGSQAWRVNLSAAAAAVAAAIGIFTLTRRLGVVPLGAFLAALAFGLAPSVWSRASEIEAYTLNAAFITIILHLGVSLFHNASRFTFYGLAFTFGLALTNHLTAAMLAPALAFAGLWYLSKHWRTLQPSSFILLALAFLLGLSIYLYLPLRWPFINNGELLSLQQFGYFLRGGEAAGQLDIFLPFRELQRFEYVWRKITLEFGWLGFAFMLVGAFASLLPRSLAPLPKRIGLFLLLAYAGFIYFTLAYNPPEPDFSDFFIATYVMAAVWLALGLQFITFHASRFMPKSYGLLFTLFTFIPLSSIWQTLPRFNYAAAQVRYELGQYTLAQPLAENAAILADPKRFAVPYYLQNAEGQRRDLEIMVLPDEASYRAELDARVAAGQTVYVARYLPGLFTGYSLRSVGPLVEVSVQPFTTPPQNIQPLNSPLTDGIQLAGFSREGASRFTLYWHAPQTPTQHLVVYLRLLSVEGGVVWQSAGQVPVGGLYPTNAWRASEYVSDWHEVPLAEDLPPGSYELQVGLFPPFAPTESGWAAVAQVEQQTSGNVAIPKLLRANLGGQWLLGYSAPETALPDSPVSVTLYWLKGAAQEVTAFNQTRSLAAWQLGEIVPLTYQLRTPNSGSEFPLSASSGQPAHCGFLRGETLTCELPAIQLVGQSLPENAINFNGELVLRRATLETATVAPGGEVRVGLEWQALRGMSQSYTVFVHVVGPDGKLYGQKDYWPVEGTRLTTDWQAGEVIVDPYRVPLAADAPAGEYSVHVGLYLLETLERLPVLNTAGQPLDDKVIVGGLQVRP
jgi:hypothetical protein